MKNVSPIRFKRKHVTPVQRKMSPVRSNYDIVWFGEDWTPVGSVKVWDDRRVAMISEGIYKYGVFFFFFILRRMRKNKALAHHTSTYFHTRMELFVFGCVEGGLRGRERDKQRNPPNPSRCTSTRKTRTHNRRTRLDTCKALHRLRQRCRSLRWRRGRPWTNRLQSW